MSLGNKFRIRWNYNPCWKRDGMICLGWDDYRESGGPLDIGFTFVWFTVVFEFGEDFDDTPLCEKGIYDDSI